MATRTTTVLHKVAHHPADPEDTFHGQLLRKVDVNTHHTVSHGARTYHARNGHIQTPDKPDRGYGTEWYDNQNDAWDTIDNWMEYLSLLGMTVTVE